MRPFNFSWQEPRTLSIICHLSWLCFLTKSAPAQSVTICRVLMRHWQSSPLKNVKYFHSLYVFISCCSSLARVHFWQAIDFISLVRWNNFSFHLFFSLAFVLTFLLFWCCYHFSPTRAFHWRTTYCNKNFNKIVSRWAYPIFLFSLI